MKKLLLSLMVLATLASCGKDNKVSSNGTTSTTTPTTVTNPLVTGSTQAQALITMINNPSSFGQGTVSLGNASQNCQTKWTIFYYCTSTSSAGTTTTWNQIVAQYPNLVYQYSNGNTVRHADVNIANKQAELISILNSATAVQVSGYIFYVTVGSNYYVIDARYPIQANPSGAYANGSQYYLVQAI